jgi:hypothetical protein
MHPADRCVWLAGNPPYAGAIDQVMVKIETVCHPWRVEVSPENNPETSFDFARRLMNSEMLPHNASMSTPTVMVGV